MRTRALPAFFVSVLILAACTQSGTPEGTASSSSSSLESSESSVAPITRNVSYMGTVEDLGVTIYQEGTHKLSLESGQFILLSSTDANLNLNAYLGKKVEVRGSVQATVEAGGTLMRVEEITILEAGRSSSVASSKKFCGGIAGFQCGAGEECVDDPSDSCDPMNGGADCGGMCVTASSSSAPVAEASSVSSVTSSVQSTVKSSSSKAAVSSISSVQSSVASSPSTVTSGALESQIALMAKQDYATPSLWTQQYCTSHVAFCIPVHKNWYFKSFGATTSNQWHVEFAMMDITELGQGPIVMNLIGGTSASMSATDGAVQTRGSEVIGFRDWRDGTHFEIIADARLKAAVQYMLDHITSYTPAQ
jgi:hypothetical protein